MITYTKPNEEDRSSSPRNGVVTPRAFQLWTLEIVGSRVLELG